MKNPSTDPGLGPTPGELPVKQADPDPLDDGLDRLAKRRVTVRAEQVSPDAAAIAEYSAPRAAPKANPVNVHRAPLDPKNDERLFDEGDPSERPFQVDTQPGVRKKQERKRWSLIALALMGLVVFLGALTLVVGKKKNPAPEGTTVTAVVVTGATVQTAVPAIPVLPVETETATATPSASSVAMVHSAPAVMRPRPNAGLDILSPAKPKPVPSAKPVVVAPPDIRPTE